MNDFVDGEIQLSEINPHVMYYIFLPLLIFDSSFNGHFHVIKQQLLSAILLAGPGVLISMAIIPICGIYIFPYNWSWLVGLMFGSILSATDPIAVVARLHDSGASKTLASLIDSESLLNDGSAFVIFLIFQNLFIDGDQSAKNIITNIVKYSIGNSTIPLCVRMIILNRININLPATPHIQYQNTNFHNQMLDPPSIVSTYFNQYYSSHLPSYNSMDPNGRMFLDPGHPSMSSRGLSSLPPSDRMQEHVYKLPSSYDGKMYTRDPYVGSPRGRQQTHARVLPMESQIYHPYHYQRIHRSSHGMYFNDGSSLPLPTPPMNHTHVSLIMPIQSSNTHDLGPSEPPNGQQIGTSSSYASSTNVANSQQPRLPLTASSSNSNNDG